jgi:hypothetical protein
MTLQALDRKYPEWIINRNRKLKYFFATNVHTGVKVSSVSVAGLEAEIRKEEQK